jgi:uncharacterized membrane protein YbaN (DUF454 family)
MDPRDAAGGGTVMQALNHLLDDAVGPGLEVVHSSYGRLRVHLPDEDGFLAARLCDVPGVTSAEASAWTGNLLIRFDPLRTSAPALLAELHTLRGLPPLVAPLPTPIEPLPLTIPSGDYVTGTRATVYKALGWASVGMAGVGAALPGIPTVPFVVLAAYFFVRSSPEAHAWLRRSRWFGELLRDWEEHRAVRRSVKYTGMGLMGAGLVITALLGLPVPVLATIIALELIGLGILIRLPVVEGEPPAPAPANL